jgi:antagonist of KipI
MKIRMLKPGIQASIQDRGRTGFQNLGVPVCGFMDPMSASVANWLCGNKSGAALIEQTLHGQEWQIESGGVMAICGGGARIFAGEECLPFGRVISVQAGAVLSFKPDPRGCRSYLAMEGGVRVNPQLGSVSTYVSAGIGGKDGRYLETGDILESEPAALFGGLNAAVSNEQPRATYENWGIDLSPLLFSGQSIRFIRGPEFHWFEDNERDLFQHAEFRVSAQSNRMGYLLDGPLITRTGGGELLSTAVTRGTIQITHQGSPIILMADAQTIGGYPRIGQVAAVDLPQLAQMRPGERIRFLEIPWEEAENLYFERETWMRELKEAIRLRSKC